MHSLLNLSMACSALSAIGLEDEAWEPCWRGSRFPRLLEQVSPTDECGTLLALARAPSCDSARCACRVMWTWVRSLTITSPPTLGFVQHHQSKALISMDWMGGFASSSPTTVLEDAAHAQTLARRVLKCQVSEAPKAQHDPTTTSWHHLLNSSDFNDRRPSDQPSPPHRPRGLRS